MPFEPRATSFSLANAQILAQAAAMAYGTPARCAKWAKVSGFTGRLRLLRQPRYAGVRRRKRRRDRRRVSRDAAEPADGLVRGLPRDPRALGPQHRRGARRVLCRASQGVGRDARQRRSAADDGSSIRGNKTIWITGHSLGGALAELCAAQAMFVSQDSRPGRLHVRTAARRQQGLRQRRQREARVWHLPIRERPRHRPQGSAVQHGLLSLREPALLRSRRRSRPRRESAVETIARMRSRSPRARSTSPSLGQVAGLVTDGLKSIIHGDFTEEHEKAFRERATEILKGGVEKIDDHSMDKHYLVRLKTSLPQM